MKQAVRLGWLRRRAERWNRLAVKMWNEGVKIRVTDSARMGGGARAEEGAMTDECRYCGQAVEYPDGLHLASGREVHVVCYQRKRDEIERRRESQKVTA